jgi:hypothetical protein
VTLSRRRPSPPDDAGRGDVPLIQLRWRCSQCRSARIDMICTSHARVQPAPNQPPTIST